MTVTIRHGDCREVLRTLPDESVHCCVTSPPYWGLRDYGVDGQIGLEETFEDFLAGLVDVFAEVRRVLRSDGTCWVNMGDSYCSTDKWGGGGGNTGKQTVAADGSVPSWAVRQRKKPQTGFKPKDLMMQPARLALALQADGWWLRSEIIWSKPNPMPEGVTDRPTSAHEKIYLITKSARYAYDGDAIRTPLAPKTFTTFGTEHRPQGNDALGGVKSDNWGKSLKTRAPKVKVPSGWDRGAGGHGTIHREGRGKPEYQEVELAGANARNVWEIPSKPFPEAHFATFPPEVAERCIKAGCPAGGVVLDPFGGAGTTGMVADRLGRNAVLIELNPEYATIAERRIKNDAGFLADVERIAP